MSTEEKEIYSFIANSKSVYVNSVEKPSTVYYNVDSKLKVIHYKEKEKEW